MLSFKSLHILVVLLSTLVAGFPASVSRKSEKPTILVVCGAWHQPLHYTAFTDLLKVQGYPVVIHANPSYNSSTPFQATTANDAQFVRQSLMGLIQEGKDVLVFAHSYGGIPGGAAAYGLSKNDLSGSAGYSGGGVIGLVYLAAFAVPNGASLTALLPNGEFAPWTIPDNTTGQLMVQDPKNVFYADVNPPFDQIAIDLIRDQAEASFLSPSGPPAWAEPAFNGRRAYIYTLQDMALPLVGQNAIVAASGVDWQIKSINSSHSPFLSQPVTLTSTVLSILASFGGNR